MENSKIKGLKPLVETDFVSLYDVEYKNKKGQEKHWMVSSRKSKEELEKVTEMFYTTKPTGSGLGVALSNEIIKAHNGELIYTSEKNKGTKVTIRLPYNG